MYIYEKKSLKMTTLQIVFNSGCLYEVEGRFGTMHLMEHLICKTFEDLQSTLTKKSVAWNAYTCSEQVVFHFSGLDSQLDPELKRTLVNRILGSLDMISQEAFDNEKSTVLQEYGDSFNDPDRSAILNLYRKKFNFYDAIGKRSDIEKFTLDDAKSVKATNFTKPARIIEVGPTKTDFSSIEYNENTVQTVKLKYSKGYDVELENSPESDKTLVVALSKKIIKKSDYPYVFMAAKMISSGLESPLYQEIRVKRGLSYYSIASVDPIINEATMYLCACTAKEKSDELVGVYSDFLKDIKENLKEERFEDIKSAIKLNIEKRKILRYASVDDLVRKNFVQLPKNIDKIKFDKVVEVASKYFNLDNIEIIKAN